MKPINSHAPIRPRYLPGSDQMLMFATMPQKNHTGRYQVTSPKNMIAQARLYRAVRKGEIPNNAAIEEIYDYVFFDQPLVSKNLMGATVIRTVLFEPRRLKGVTKDNPRARSTYRFNDIKELEYGLEWMICTWLRKFLNEESAPGGKPVSGPEMMAEELDILANTHEDDYKVLYEDEFWKKSYKDPDWAALVSGRSEIRELLGEPKMGKEPKGKLRSFSRPELPKSLG